METRPPDTGRTEKMLRRAAARYRWQQTRIRRLQREASADLASEVLTAHRSGMRKTQIVLALEGTWGKTWVDRVCRGDTGGQP